MRSVLVGIALLFAIGCGMREITLPESGADLSGTVTYNNEKVLVASVVERHCRQPHQRGWHIPYSQCSLGTSPSDQH